MSEMPGIDSRYLHLTQLISGIWADEVLYDTFSAQGTTDLRRSAALNWGISSWLSSKKESFDAFFPLPTPPLSVCFPICVSVRSIQRPKVRPPRVRARNKIGMVHWQGKRESGPRASGQIWTAQARTAKLLSLALSSLVLLCPGASPALARPARAPSRRA